jgi:predicted metal-dependent enzyme (double-stranded beta helix superfamily)
MDASLPREAAPAFFDPNTDPSTNRAHPAFSTLSARFAAGLEMACGAPAAQFGARIRAVLDEAQALAACLPAEVLAGKAHGYSRHMLACDPAGRFAAAAIVWRPGQCTPVHGHQTWCGFRIVKGVLSEERFTWNAQEERAFRVEQRQCAAGESSFVPAGFGGIHRIANHSALNAVSFHVYGVHADDIATRVNRLVETAEPLDLV